jgi:hypothetical protein
MIEILGTIKAASETVKSIRSLSNEMATAELKLKIAELMEQLADLKIQSIELAEQNNSLQAEVKRLAKPPEFQFRDEAYWNGEDGPFCPTCYDNGRPVRMQKLSRAFASIAKFRCNTCETKII